MSASKIKFLFIAALCIGCVVGLDCISNGKWPQPAMPGNESAPLSPDLQNITIPPNIAPLNFKILRPAIHYRVVLTPREGHPLVIESAAPSIVFPEKKWKTILGRNVGRDLVLTLSIRGKSGGYQCFAPCTIHVAREPVDPYLAYRVIKPIYNWWRDVGIYARDLTTFEQREIVTGGRFDNGCVNCHSFCGNDPNHFIVSARSKKFGNACIFVVNDRAFKQNSKFGYSSWHPSGKFIVFSNMQVNQFFHTARSEIRDVVDMYSYLACFDTKKRTILKIDNLVNPRELQTYPAWSPDGKTLYFCTAPVLWDNCDTIPPRNYAKVRYNLQKISYDASSDTWGKPGMLLSSDRTGLSIVMPRVSPDGKFLIFCMCDYGVFPAFQKSGDLYCMDLATGDYRKLDCNSGESEAWHAWSSNSRWIAFSSKRADGVFTRIYLCYIDKSGKSGKPFVLPQEDPAFYDSFMKTYSVPEFLTGPPIVRPEEIGRAERTVSAATDAKTSATIRSDTSASPHQ